MTLKPSDSSFRDNATPMAPEPPQTTTDSVFFMSFVYLLDLRLTLVKQHQPNSQLLFSSLFNNFFNFKHQTNEFKESNPSISENFM